MKYKHQEIENKWQKKWGNRLQFKAKDFSKKKKFYALVEFPYPSGSGLHTGHAFNYTLMDVFARKKRMDGFNVLCPMGWDAFGLPTENYAIKTGIHPIKATKQNTDTFRTQMKKMGFGFNWDREINTTKPDYYQWTQWIFQQLFKHGLAYKKEMEINWCPSCKIGLANEEVVDDKCERCGADVGKKKLSQWLLKITAYADRLADELDLVDYPDSIIAAQRSWIGRSEGALIDFPLVDGQENIKVFTTRPDTIFGATFIVLAPEHNLVKKIVYSEYKQEVEEYIKKAKKKIELERTDEKKPKTGVFIGAYAKNPLNGVKIPIYIADFVIMSYGSGAIMGVPAHDKRDWQFAKKYNLEIKEVISGGNPEKEPYDGYGKLVNSGEYNGYNFEKAKKQIISDLEEIGLAEKKIQYHLRDWIFSRQHYWGEPIPMVYCDKCAKKGINYWDTEEGKKIQPIFEPDSDLAGWFPILEKDLPLELPDVEKYKPTDTGESPLAGIKNWVKVKCPICNAEAKRETDTMPNWAGSSWYYLRYADTKNNKVLADRKKLDYWLPVDFYLGGAEHTTLHLLYSRFWHKFLNDLDIIPGKEPYQKRRNRGLILGEDGQKMSKSKGNIVSPNEIIEKYGADTLRTYLVFMGPYNNVLPWITNSVKGIKRFLDRIYIFVLNQKQGYSKDSNRDILTLINRLVKEVGEDIDALKYNTAVAKMMKFLNTVENEEVSLEDVKKFVLILAPFAPYLSEELWQELGGKFSVHQQSWPDYDEKLIEQEKVVLVIQVNGKVRGKIEINNNIDKPEATRLALDLEKIQKWIQSKTIKKVVFIKNKLINIVV